MKTPLRGLQVNCYIISFFGGNNKAVGTEDVFKTTNFSRSAEGRFLERGESEELNESFLVL